MKLGERLAIGHTINCYSLEVVSYIISWCPQLSSPSLFPIFFFYPPAKREKNSNTEQNRPVDFAGQH